MCVSFCVVNSIKRGFNWPQIYLICYFLVELILKAKRFGFVTEMLFFFRCHTNWKTNKNRLSNQIWQENPFKLHALIALILIYKILVQSSSPVTAIPFPLSQYTSQHINIFFKQHFDLWQWQNVMKQLIYLLVIFTICVCDGNNNNNINDTQPPPY